MAEGNILVIDDELVMCEFLRDLLEDRGYSVSFALSGNEGIKAFQDGRFDAVVCDLKMPDIDGIDVLQEIKRTDPDSVVIVITGYPSFETVQTSLRLGAYDYITKPVNIGEVSFVIKRAVAFRNLTLTNKKLMKELEEQNIKLEEKVKERTKELTILYSIGLDVLSTLKLDEVLQIIVDRVCGVLDLEICSVLLVDKESESLRIRFSRGLDKEIIKNTKLKIGELISGWVAEHKEPVLVENIETDPRFARRSQEKYYTHSFISVPLVVREEVIGVINVNNKRSKEPFTEDDFRFIKGIANEAAIAVENAQLYSSLEDTYLRTVMALTSAVDARDHYTKTHSEHVTEYAVAIAKEMGFSDKDIEELKQACQLHDLGKIGVHDFILTKPGKLTPDEWDEIKLHTLKSAEILRPLLFLDGVIELVEQHHERYDGKGYPFGIKGENIRLGARIMAVADSFDAMITERPYRKAFTKEEAIEELKKCSGTQFDPKVVEAFLKVLEKNPDILNTLYQT
jgi:putative nucleotidyltransferase with HDIG domain